MLHTLLLVACRPPSEPPVEPTGTDADDPVVIDTATQPEPGPLGRTPPIVDLAEHQVRRLYGSATVRGNLGVPVGAGDVDGDGLADMVMGVFRASPDDREWAGIVYVSLGDGTTTGEVDTAVASPDLLVVHGAGTRENAGSEVWVGDVTGDGIGDVLIGRQNASGGRWGAGALTILPGGADLVAWAATLQPLDLADPPPWVLTLQGPEEGGRLGIWMRIGDVTGDGIPDFVVGGDQERDHAGGAWVVEGGPWLAGGGTVDLARFGTTSLEGHLLHVRGDPADEDGHLGATVQLGDLDDNGRADVILASALNRAGASTAPAGGDPSNVHGRGGVPRGRATVIWDDLLGLPWASGATLDLADPPEGVTTFSGMNRNNTLGEELVGGFDWDADGRADLMMGDLASDLSPAAGRPNAGSAIIVYSPADFRGMDIELESPPAEMRLTRFYGADIGDLLADTAAGGDFDGDGIDDLALTSPDADPDGRDGAGQAVVAFGMPGGWPTEVDLRHARLPQRSMIRVVEIWGAHGTTGFVDLGDMLAYSGGAADVDGDGLQDLVVNEMLGNGLAPGSDDAGNAVAIPGALLAEVEASSE